MSRVEGHKVFSNSIVGEGEVGQELAQGLQGGEGDAAGLALEHVLVCWPKDGVNVLLPYLLKEDLGDVPQGKHDNHISTQHVILREVLVVYVPNHLLVNGNVDGEESVLP